MLLLGTEVKGDRFGRRRARVDGNRFGPLTERVPATPLQSIEFPAIGRATKQFERRSKGRTAVERVNARLKVFWGADDGNVVGARRFHAHVGVVMVHLALARWLAGQPRYEGSLSAVSLSPIAQALARLDEEYAQGPLPEQGPVSASA